MRSFLGISGLFLCLATWSASSAAEPAGWFISLDRDQGVAVLPVFGDVKQMQGNSDGLLIVRQGVGERWSRVTAEKTTGQLALAVSSAQLQGETRGGPPGGDVSLQPVTAFLDQVASGEVVRGGQPGGIFSPMNDGVQANPQITIRRLPLEGEEKFPADNCILYQGRNEIARFTFPAGKDVVKWSELDGLAKDFKSGLTPGVYLLRLQGAKDDTRFTLVEAGRYTHALDRSRRLATLLPKSEQLLGVQMLVEELLSASDDDGTPMPLIIDAYDQLDRQELSPRLSKLKQSLSERLSGAESPTQAADQESTGLEQIDWARDHIALGQWNSALAALDEVEQTGSARAKALAHIYRAVVLAESGALTSGAAEFEFGQAVQATAAGTAADRFRVHNNYANYLLRQAQNRLYNRSFRMATGATNEMFHALLAWQRGAEQFGLAQGLVKDADQQASAALSVNLARHYALLADAIFLVNSGLPSEERFEAGEQAATAQARAMAQRALKDPQADLPTRAAAAEVLAVLMHRAHDEAACRQYAEQALGFYGEMGSILGAEGVLRLIGLSYASQAQSDASPAEYQAEAIRFLTASHLLAEHLRKQFPTDIIGLSRAGFLARRAYVGEMLVELLLEAARPAEALRVLETGKAQALQDVLLLKNIAAAKNRPAEISSDVLKQWPADVVAIEYFFGPRRVWVFCVRGSDQVKAYPLTARDGEPIPPASLVADVRGFLNRMEGAAAKMLRSASPSEPFDGSWQDELHRYYDILLPKPVRDQFADGQQVVIVPHHILHYFPFAALVTERDTAKRGPFQSYMPTFWIESGVNLIYAPSLTAWRTLRANDEAITEVRAVGVASFDSAKPLPGVKQDLENLHQVFSQRIKSAVTGANITETAFYEALREPGLTFIGTHGVNLADEPLASYLLCHATADSDGRLMAGEIYGTDLAANVVVLSACYSGLADRSPLPGDDLFGIERALLHSGVQTVVDGLWDVYDDTGTVLMRSFFENCSKGATTPCALAEAQREFLRQRRMEGPGDPWIHPYFWSVYKASGSDRTHFGNASN